MKKAAIERKKLLLCFGSTLTSTAKACNSMMISQVVMYGSQGPERVMSHKDNSDNTQPCETPDGMFPKF